MYFVSCHTKKTAFKQVWKQIKYVTVRANLAQGCEHSDWREDILSQHNLADKWNHLQQTRNGTRKCDLRAEWQSGNILFNHVQNNYTQ